MFEDLAGMEKIFTSKQQNKDLNRASYLETLGITVLRFTNLDILQQAYAVLSKINATILHLTSPRYPLATALGIPTSYEGGF